MDKDNSYDYVQKSWTVEYKVRITEDHIEYYVNTLENEYEIYVHFTFIQERKRIRHQTINTMDGNLYGGLLIVIIVSISLLIAGRGNVITSIFGILSIAFAIAGFWIYRVKEIGIPFLDENGIDYMSIFENKPKNGFGLTLVDKIYEARSKYLRNEFFKIIEDNPKEEELERMEWLYKEEVINKSEYHLMIELIEDTFKNN